MRVRGRFVRRGGWSVVGAAVRIRMVMCGEVLVDEAVSDRDDFSEVMQRALLDEEVRNPIGPGAMDSARQTACDEWRRERAEFRKKGP